MRRIVFAWLALATACAFPAFGHGGADHSHDAPDLSAAAEIRPITSVAGKGNALDISVSPPSLRVGEEAMLTLFVADWNTNRPVTGAEMDITLTGAGKSLDLKAESGEDPGVYAVTLPALPSGTYGLLVDIRAMGTSELIGVAGLTVGASQESESEESEPMANPRDFTPYYIAGAALLAGMAGFALGAGNRRNAGTKGASHEAN